MIAAIAAAVDPDPLPRRPGEPLTICGVMDCWPNVFSIAAARAASVCAWSRIAFRLTMRSIRLPSRVACAGGDLFNAVQGYPAVLLDCQGIVGWL
jgi:hypothetical protein